MGLFEQRPRGCKGAGRGGEVYAKILSWVLGSDVGVVKEYVVLGGFKSGLVEI